MISVSFSSSFKKAFKKKIQKNKDPFDKRLKTHKLTGELEELWSFRINYEIRVIFFFVNKNKAVLNDIGTHEEVY